MGKAETIYCPICGRTIYHWDGKSTMIKHLRCKKCQMMIEIDPVIKKHKIKKLPERACGSGMTFW